MRRERRKRSINISIATFYEQPSPRMREFQIPAIYRHTETDITPQTNIHTKQDVYSSTSTHFMYDVLMHGRLE